MSEEEYHSWLEEWRKAETALEGREEQLFDTAKKIEQKLELLGTP